MINGNSLIDLTGGFGVDAYFFKIKLFKYKGNIHFKIMHYKGKYIFFYIKY